MVTPIPRYIHIPKSCCADADHNSNMGGQSYRAALESAVSECRRGIKDFCFRQGVRNVRVMGPWKDLAGLGDAVWGDAVHLTDHGYQEVAKLVMQTDSELASKIEAGADRTGKRPRELSLPGWQADQRGNRPPPPHGSSAGEGAIRRKKQQNIVVTCVWVCFFFSFFYRPPQLAVQLL